MRAVVVTVVSLFSIASLVHAAEPRADARDVAVPDALKAWIPWVLNDVERCPQRVDGAVVCQSPGKLDLVVNKTGGAFTIAWRIDAAALAAVPGDAHHWPLDVNVDGKPAVVVQAGGVPEVNLAVGDHTVSGRFSWDAPPESVPIPADTGVVHLVVAGKDVPFVDRGDAGDRVWLKRDSAGEERDEDRLDITVFRKILDGVPLLVETQVLLEVSGKAREVTVPGALLEGFTPLSLSGTLPAHVDTDSAASAQMGALKVQVRAGRHTLFFVQRRDSDDRTLTAPAAATTGTPADPAAEPGREEVWVFQADHAVRVANVTGVPSIVAEQTRLPEAWRALPAYRVLPGEKVVLDQQRRGDESPPPSQLTLMRTMWLDFDGHGYTVHDELGGRFTGDRLLMGAGTTLGRVATGDTSSDAFITRIGTGEIGVEVRSPDLRVTADSRIEAHGLGDASTFPAVSWAHDFQSVNLLLHLPPGFRLLHASGVDEVNTTWVKSWTLFELFLVVVITLAMGRLFGPVVGGVSLVTMVLTFQEEGAPRGLWIAVLTLAALHRVLPPAWETRGIATVLRVLRICLAIGVALVAVVFSVQQIRQGMYPVLEQEDRRVGDGQLWGRLPYGEDSESSGMLTLAAKGEPMAQAPNAPNAAATTVEVPVQADDFKDNAGIFGKREENRTRGIAVAEKVVDQLASNQQRVLSDSSSSNSYGAKIAQKKQKLNQIDPSSVVQTGPGLPQWGFTTVRLNFTGPVNSDQRIHLLLLGPMVNLALAFLRVLLVAFLVVVAFGFPGAGWPTMLLKAFRGKGALFAAAVLFLVSTSSRAEPSEQLLADLKARLTQPAACAPQCGDIARVALEADATSLRLRAEVHAAAAVVIPLPGGDKQWSAQTVVVDGKAWSGVSRQGNALWIALPAGRHDVVLSGALPSRDSVQLAFPLLPHRATFTSSTWTVDGIHEDGVPDANLQLSRVSRVAKSAHEGSSAEASVLPAFLSVERSLLLGISFEVETRVTRLSPVGVPVVLEVPLLPGENVTTEGVRVEGKKAFLSLGPNDTEVTWSGVLSATDTLELVAGQNVPFVEVWSLQASPVWHVEETGIPPLHDESPREGGARAWRPWPGEKLALVVTRPEGVPGQTVTIERTSQQVRPGLRSTDVTLTLDLRASRGGEHVVTLPAGAELLSATVNNVSQPLRPTGDKVTVPVVPGKQQVVLVARVPAGVTTLFHTPRFDAGQKSVNAEVLIEVPGDRWILFATGPRAGPAVLFWSFLVILIVSGIGLSRVPFSPLKLHHWILLGLGLTQVPVAVAAMVAGWLLALGWRKHQALSPGWFNLRQVVLVGWTVAALIGLVASIHEGLLGAPDMQIAGNGSHAGELRWFADHADALLPSTLMLSLPMAAYRVAMLGWALWLAYALLQWLRFGWAAFADGGMWRAVPKAPPRPKPHAPMPAVPEAGAPTSAAVPSTSPVPPAVKE